MGWSESSKVAYLPLSSSASASQEDLAIVKPRAWTLTRPRGARLAALFLLALCSCYAIFNLPTSSSAAEARQDEETQDAKLSQEREAFIAASWQPFNALDASPLLPTRPPNTADQTPGERILSAACADQFIAAGQLCNDVDLALVQEQSRLSAIWTWENGSDPILAASRQTYLGSDELKSGRDERHFRTHNELRHSIRSVLRAFHQRWHQLGSFHVFSTDLPAGPGRSSARWGLLPAWLDSDHLKHANITLRPEFPWLNFKTRSISAAAALEWRDQVLPTFQSMSVESQLPNIKTDSDFVLSMCDDFFLMRELSTADVATPLFGPVFHMQSNLLITPSGGQQFAPGSKELDGEWASLGYAAQLLDERFGLKQRPYPTHHFKSFSMPLMREVAVAYAEELRETASARFRGHGPKAEVNMALLYMNWVIERHREALLWSFVVGKSDSDSDGNLSQEERREMVRIIQSARVLEDTIEDVALIRRPQRSYGVYNLALQQLGLEEPRQTQVRLSSMTNGFAYLAQKKAADIGHSLYDKWTVGGWARFDQEPDEQAYCELPLACFQLAEPSALFSSDVFKCIAFENAEAGNCLIAALLSVSGEQGFESFLPSASHTGFHSQPSISQVLPITKTWQDVDFSQKRVVPSELDLRQFCVRLLQRYAWTVGDVSLSFVRMGGPKETAMKLNAISSFNQEKGPGQQDPALLALNDDISSERFSEDIDEILTGFYAKHFGEQAEWESTVA